MNKYDYVGMVIYQCLALCIINVINELRKSQISILICVDGKSRADVEVVHGAAADHRLALTSRPL